MSGFAVRDAVVMRNGRRVVDGVTLSVGAGECVGLIGPNGAGKTTLMRAALGLLPLAGGTSSLAALRPEARALTAAWLPQAREVAWPIEVTRLVALGRLPHGPVRPGDPAVARAIAALGLGGLVGRAVTELSGGEQARVLIARAVAQEAPVLLADEPVAGLDPAAQIAAMRVFRAEAAAGRAVMVALHDLSLAARHCSRLVALKAGRVIADGPPAEVLRPEVTAEVFGVRGSYAEGADGPVFHVVDVLEGRG